jgi:hypothetical protein
MKAHKSLLLVFLTLCVTASAQDNNSNLPKPQEERIDIKGFRQEGGIVSVIEGDARLLDQKGSAHTLKALQEVNAGDEIQVGPKSYVEVLLNPGTYLRISPQAGVRFLSLVPDNLKFQLVNGSLILEHSVRPLMIFEKPDRKLTPNDLRTRFASEYLGITVLTSSGDIITANGGIYRCDIDSSGRGFVTVGKGVAAVAGGILSDGMSTALGDRVPVIKNVEPEDSFDIWSHRRADKLVELNLSLRNTSWAARLRNNPWSFLNIEYDKRLDRMKDAMIINASGGNIAFVEPGAQYKAPGESWRPLTTDDELKDGYGIATGPNARAEIHLFPQCYLLLSHNTEIVYRTHPEAGPTITVMQGSAIIVSTLLPAAGWATSLIAPDGEVAIPGAGIIRLNVYPRRRSEVFVYEGRVKIRGREVLANNRVPLGTTEVAPEPIRQMDIDPFELWSLRRSMNLANTLIALPPGRRSAPEQKVDYEVDAFKRGKVIPQRSNRVSTAGLWYFDPSAKAYTFVPNTYEQKSPYGGKYQVTYRRADR